MSCGASPGTIVLLRERQRSVNPVTLAVRVSPAIHRIPGYGELWFKQAKTGQRVRVKIEGALAEVLDRIAARQAMTASADAATANNGEHPSDFRERMNATDHSKYWPGR